jgi:hypothetical protein
MRGFRQLPTTVVLSLALGCSAGGTDKGSKTSNGSGGSLSLGGGDTGPKGGSAGSLSIDPNGGGGPTPVGPCEGGGWRCQVPDCTGQEPTSIRATVYDPAGVTPLYNVAVYVPNSDIAPIMTGATCETCATPVSGDPIAAAITNAQGEFTMNEGVPAGTNVPVVLQIGKWRRKIELPEVKPCQ